MCKILIVDDETSIRDMVQSYLSSLSFTYKSSSNSIEALTAIQKYPNIRICIIDLHLPGVDGLSLCRKIKRMDPLMVTIAMTGFNTLFSLVECREAGFDDVIFKPFDFELLKKLLVEYNTKLERWNKTNV